MHLRAVFEDVRAKMIIGPRVELESLIIILALLGAEERTTNRLIPLLSKVQIAN
jgi:hypothetical protein